MPTPEQLISHSNYRIAAALDVSLRKVAGERMGFCLVVFPLNREGESVMCSNVKRAQAEGVMAVLLEESAGAADFVPFTGH